MFIYSRISQIKLKNDLASQFISYLSPEINVSTLSLNVLKVLQIIILLRTVRTK